MHGEEVASLFAFKLKFFFFFAINPKHKQKNATAARPPLPVPMMMMMVLVVLFVPKRQLLFVLLMHGVLLGLVWLLSCLVDRFSYLVNCVNRFMHNSFVFFYNLLYFLLLLEVLSRHYASIFL